MTTSVTQRVDQHRGHVSPQSGSPMLALARAEAVRLVRHPLVLGATALIVLRWILDAFSDDAAVRSPVLFEADRTTQLPMLLLGIATLLAANLAVLRGHRHHADVFYDVLVLPAWRRVAAHLLALAPVGALAGVLVAGWTLWLAVQPHAIGRPNGWELATGPAVVLLLGAVGVLVATVVRATIAAPMLLVVVAAFLLLFGALRGVGSTTAQWSWLGLVELGFPRSAPLPAHLLGRPASWHLLYLISLVGIIAMAAIARRGGWGRLCIAALAVAVVAAGVGGVMQIQPPSKQLLAARQAATERPASQQVCQQRGTVTYCAFPDWIERVDQWDPIVAAVRSALPPAAASQPFTVRQRVDARQPDANGVFSAIPRDAWLNDDRRAGTPQPVVPVSTAWGAGKQEFHFAGLLLVSLTGGLPLDRGPYCGGRSIVVGWLATTAIPRGRAGLAEARASSSLPGFEAIAGMGVNMAGPEMAVIDELLSRPDGDVRALVRRHWDKLIDPDTTTEQAATILSATVPPPDPTPYRFTC